MDHGSPRPRAASSLRSSDATPSKCSSMDTRPRPSPSGSDSPARHQLQTAVRLHLRCRRVSRAIRIFAVETPRSPSSTASAWRWSTLGCGVLDGDAGNDRASLGMKSRTWSQSTAHSFRQAVGRVRHENSKRRLPECIAHFFGRDDTNVVARSIQPANCSSSSTPSGSTMTQPFMGRPVMSNTLTWDSRSESS
jgi:hypothetical protein